MSESHGPLTTGVAIVTYNGLKYVAEQLDSILAQTRAVNHIVVSDDHSTDGTWEFLQSWAERAPVPVNLIRNEVQLGLSRNVEQAIKAVRADIIFTADQDDVWFADKVATLAAVFENDPQVQLVHTDAILVDSQRKDLGTRLFSELEITDAEYEAIETGHAFRVYLRRNVVTGATTAFRRSLYEQAQPLPPNIYHDAWLAFFALAIGKVRLLKAPTIAYRQHGANLVGVKKLGSGTKLRRLWWKLNTEGSLVKTLGQIAAQHGVLHARLLAQPTTPAIFERYTRDALQFITERQRLPRNPVTRTLRVLGNARAGQYGRFSYESRTDMLRDILGR